MDITLPDRSSVFKFLNFMLTEEKDVAAAKNCEACRHRVLLLALHRVNSENPPVEKLE